MKELPQTKTWTGDGYGASPITLDLIKRTPSVALYQRTNHDGKPGGYEVFFVKMRHKGDPLPGGLVEEEDREQYPTVNAFGKTAWFCDTMERATFLFEKMCETDALVSPAFEGETEIEPTNADNVEEAAIVGSTEVKKRHRRQKQDRPALKLPDGKFSVKELAAFNGVDYSIAFLDFKSLLESGAAKHVGEERRALKGKMTQLYSKV